MDLTEEGDTDKSEGYDQVPYQRFDEDDKKAILGKAKGSGSDSKLTDTTSSSCDVSTGRESHSEHTIQSSISDKQDKENSEKEVTKQRDKERDKDSGKRKRDEVTATAEVKECLRNAVGDVRGSNMSQEEESLHSSPYMREIVGSKAKTTCRLECQISETSRETIAGENPSNVFISPGSGVACQSNAPSNEEPERPTRSGKHKRGKRKGKRRKKHQETASTTEGTSSNDQTSASNETETDTLDVCSLSASHSTSEQSVAKCSSVNGHLPLLADQEGPRTVPEANSSVVPLVPSQLGDGIQEQTLCKSEDPGIAKCESQIDELASDGQNIQSASILDTATPQKEVTVQSSPEQEIFTTARDTSISDQEYLSGKTQLEEHPTGFACPFPSSDDFVMEEKTPFAAETNHDTGKESVLHDADSKGLASVASQEGDVSTCVISNISDSIDGDENEPQLPTKKDSENELSDYTKIPEDTIGEPDVFIVGAPNDSDILQTECPVSNMHFEDDLLNQKSVGSISETHQDCDQTEECPEGHVSPTDIEQNGNETELIANAGEDSAAEELSNKETGDGDIIVGNYAADDNTAPDENVKLEEEIANLHEEKYYENDKEWDKTLEKSKDDSVNRESILHTESHGDVEEVGALHDQSDEIECTRNIVTNTGECFANEFSDHREMNNEGENDFKGIGDNDESMKDAKSDLKHHDFVDNQMENGEGSLVPGIEQDKHLLVEDETWQYDRDGDTQNIDEKEEEEKYDDIAIQNNEGPCMEKVQCIDGLEVTEDIRETGLENKVGLIIENHNYACGHQIGNGETGVAILEDGDYNETINGEIEEGEVDGTEKRERGIPSDAKDKANMVGEQNEKGGIENADYETVIRDVEKIDINKDEDTGMADQCDDIMKCEAGKDLDDNDKETHQSEVIGTEAKWLAEKEYEEENLVDEDHGTSCPGEDEEISFVETNAENESVINQDEVVIEKIGDHDTGSLEKHDEVIVGDIHADAVEQVINQEEAVNEETEDVVVVDREDDGEDRNKDITVAEICAGNYDKGEIKQHETVDGETENIDKGGGVTQTGMGEHIDELYQQETAAGDVENIYVKERDDNIESGSHYTAWIVTERGMEEMDGIDDDRDETTVKTTTNAGENEDWGEEYLIIDSKKDEEISFDGMPVGIDGYDQKANLDKTAIRESGNLRGIDGDENYATKDMGTSASENAEEEVPGNDFIGQPVSVENEKADEKLVQVDNDNSHDKDEKDSGLPLEERIVEEDVLEEAKHLDAAVTENYLNEQVQDIKICTTEINSRLKEDVESNTIGMVHEEIGENILRNEGREVAIESLHEQKVLMDHHQSAVANNEILCAVHDAKDTLTSPIESKETYTELVQQKDAASQQDDCCKPAEYCHGYGETVGNTQQDECLDKVGGFMDDSVWKCDEQGQDLSVVANVDDVESNAISTDMDGREKEKINLTMRESGNTDLEVLAQYLPKETEISTVSEGKKENSNSEDQFCNWDALLDNEWEIIPNDYVNNHLSSQTDAMNVQYITHAGGTGDVFEHVQTESQQVEIEGTNQHFDNLGELETPDKPAYDYAYNDIDDRGMVPEGDTMECSDYEKAEIVIEEEDVPTEQKSGDDEYVEVNSSLCIQVECAKYEVDVTMEDEEKSFKQLGNEERIDEPNKCELYAAEEFKVNSTDEILSSVEVRCPSEINLNVENGSEISARDENGDLSFTLTDNLSIRSSVQRQDYSEEFNSYRPKAFDRDLDHSNTKDEDQGQTTTECDNQVIGNIQDHYCMATGEGVDTPDSDGIKNEADLDIPNSKSIFESSTDVGIVSCQEVEEEESDKIVTNTENVATCVESQCISSGSPDRNDEEMANDVRKIVSSGESEYIKGVTLSTYPEETDEVVVPDKSVYCPKEITNSESVYDQAEEKKQTTPIINLNDILLDDYDFSDASNGLVAEQYDNISNEKIEKETDPPSTDDLDKETNQTDGIMSFKADSGDGCLGSATSIHDYNEQGLKKEVNPLDSESPILEPETDNVLDGEKISFQEESPVDKLPNETVSLTLDNLEKDGDIAVENAGRHEASNQEAVFIVPENLEKESAIVDEKSGEQEAIIKELASDNRSELSNEDDSIEVNVDFKPHVNKAEKEEIDSHSQSDCQRSTESDQLPEINDEEIPEVVGAIAEELDTIVDGDTQVTTEDLQVDVVESSVSNVDDNAYELAEQYVAAIQPREGLGKEIHHRRTSPYILDRSVSKSTDVRPSSWRNKPLWRKIVARFRQPRLYSRKLTINPAKSHKKRGSQSDGACGKYEKEGRTIEPSTDLDASDEGWKTLERDSSPPTPSRGKLHRNKNNYHKGHWRRLRNLRRLRYSAEKVPERLQPVRRQIGCRHMQSTSSASFGSTPTDSKTSTDGRTSTEGKARKRRTDLLLRGHIKDVDLSRQTETINATSQEVFEVFCDNDKKEVSDLAESLANKETPTVRLLMKPLMSGMNAQACQADQGGLPVEKPQKVNQLIDESTKTKTRPSKRMSCSVM